MAATPKYKDGVYWTHRERRKSEGSNKKCSDHHAFYAGYNLTNVFSSTIKAAIEVWGLATRKFSHFKRNIKNWSGEECHCKICR